MSNVRVRFTEGTSTVIYIQFRESQALNAIHIDGKICIDVDAFNSVVGISVVTPGTKIPFKMLEKEFGVSRKLINHAQTVIAERRHG